MILVSLFGDALAALRILMLLRDAILVVWSNRLSHD